MEGVQYERTSIDPKRRPRGEKEDQVARHGKEGATKPDLFAQPGSDVGVESSGAFHVSGDSRISHGKQEQDDRGDRERGDDPVAAEGNHRGHQSHNYKQRRGPCNDGEEDASNAKLAAQFA